MLTGSTDIDDAVACMKLGAIDFLSKPYEGARLMVTVKNAIRLNALTKEVSRLKSQQEGRFSFDNLIGHDGGLRGVVHTGRKAAASDIPVLIKGETGTGKEVFARAVHGESLRAGNPFIAVNCGAIPSQLVESTLFGHEKGSFTGATDKAIGKFREAEGGTIFLDEVGELPLDTQVKLLRVLQQKEVEPVGAGKPLPINVRIISATNRDLLEEIKKGAFREDLYFRLNVLEIELCALRNRKEDIPLLAPHFIERFVTGEGLPYKDISPEAHQFLMDYDWPGNVRQLENTIHRAMVISEGAVIAPNDFEIASSPDTTLTKFAAQPSNVSSSFYDHNGAIKTMAQIEEELIQLALRHFDHNITKASQALGIAKSTFYKKIK
jgi:DNA-binding NtrC family response regulator